MTIQSLGFAQQTLFSDLKQRCVDAMFDDQFPENGSFTQKTQNSRSYWYYIGYHRNGDAAAGRQRYSKYVGPVDDPEITKRVQNFKWSKAGYRERRELVSLLRNAGMPTPSAFVGDVVEALWKAGLFRLRAILVGTLAFQTYAGFLGVKLPTSSLMTGDVDFAQFHSISLFVDDSIGPIAEILRAVDPSFREIGHMMDGRKTVAMINERGFKIEFLTPNRGGDEFAGKPTVMHALGGASAQPLRYLDFLIFKPVRSILLHKGGVPVCVPAPERYAVHKLIVSNLRRDESIEKARKDLWQAGLLAEALTVARQDIDLGHAWIEAWERGKKWRQNLYEALRRFDEQHRVAFHDAIRKACQETGKSFDGVTKPA